VRARRIHEWGGPLRLEEVFDPSPAHGEVLVKVLACSVGLTVLNMMRGDLGRDDNDLPRVPGHEVVGRIVEVGQGVEPQRLGELVCAYAYLFCGQCRSCIAGSESLCDDLAGFLGVDRDGGYAELCVLPARNAVPLPPNLDPIAASVVPDSLTTSVHICHRAALGAGDRMVVIGAGGGVGIHLVQVAGVFGAEVIGLDVESSKLQFLRAELGVEAIDSSDFDRVALPSSWSNRADVIVDLVGNRAGLTWAVDSVADNGRVVLLTTFRDADFSVAPRDIVFRQASIVGSRYASRWEMLKAGEMLAAGRIRPIISEQAGLEEVERIHKKLQAGTLLGRGVLVPA
jgi:D-arabinose 1-dehydrogenase-like Zn-dependent alcohol dehydrogenase